MTLISRCPFCKCHDVEEQAICKLQQGYYVECSCGARGPHRDTNFAAVTAWNLASQQFFLATSSPQCVANAIAVVDEFYVKQGLAHQSFLTLEEGGDLEDVAEELLRMSSLPWNMSHPVETRIQLLLEELGEFLMAIAKADEVEIVDGLADLLYVVLGTALQMKIPLAAAFHAVHKSNMTKQVSPSREERVHTKGPDYEPPKIKEIVDATRSVLPVEDGGRGQLPAFKPHVQRTSN